MPTPLEMQRTFAIVGTGGCGKTSLAEMLLYKAGAVNRLGAVEDGTTSLDYEPEEIRRRGSIQPSCATYLWNKNRHFLLDIPGDGNFTGDMECLLKGVDSVVFVLDAVDGVRPLAKKFWNIVRAAGLPAVMVVNKIDRDRADFQMALDGLAGLNVKPVVLQLPIRQGDSFVGVADVLTQRAAEVANQQEELGMPACLLVPDQIRNAIARLVRRVAPRLQVLAHSEIPETHSIRIGPILKGA